VKLIAAPHDLKGEIFHLKSPSRQLVSRPAPSYGGCTSSHAESFATEPPGITPRAIRAALLPEETADFDRDYKRALRSAGDALSLDELREVLEHWHRIACMTQADPEAHRRMLQRAEHTLRTGQALLGSVSADDVRTLIRERLGR
jgi:hypothetical protein